MTGYGNVMAKNSLPFMLNKHLWVEELQFSLLLNHPSQNPYRSYTFMHSIHLFNAMCQENKQATEITICIGIPAVIPVQSTNASPSDE